MMRKLIFCIFILCIKQVNAENKYSPFLQYNYDFSRGTIIPKNDILEYQRNIKPKKFHNFQYGFQIDKKYNFSLQYSQSKEIHSKIGQAGSNNILTNADDLLRDEYDLLLSNLQAHGLNTSSFVTLEVFPVDTPITSENFIAEYSSLSQTLQNSVEQSLQQEVAQNFNAANIYNEIYSSSNQSFNKVKLRSRLLLFNSNYNFIDNQVFSPYITTGVGIAANTLNYLHHPSENTQTTNIGKRQLSFAWQVGTGMKVALNEHIFIDLATLYYNFGSAQTGRDITLSDNSNAILKTYLPIRGIKFSTGIQIVF